MNQQKVEFLEQALRGAPAVGMATAAVAGFTLNDWLVVITIVYVVVQIGYLLHRWYRMTRRPNTRRNEEVDG